MHDTVQGKAAHRELIARNKLHTTPGGVKKCLRQLKGPTHKHCLSQLTATHSLLLSAAHHSSVSGIQDTVSKQNTWRCQGRSCPFARPALSIVTELFLSNILWVKPQNMLVYLKTCSLLVCIPSRNCLYNTKDVCAIYVEPHFRPHSACYMLRVIIKIYFKWHLIPISHLFYHLPK